MFANQTKITELNTCSLKLSDGDDKNTVWIFYRSLAGGYFYPAAMNMKLKNPDCASVSEEFKMTPSCSTALNE